MRVVPSKEWLLDDGSNHDKDEKLGLKVLIDGVEEALVDELGNDHFLDLVHGKVNVFHGGDAVHLVQGVLLEDLQLTPLEARSAGLTRKSEETSTVGLSAVITLPLHLGERGPGRDLVFAIDPVDAPDGLHAKDA